ncbi:MarR family winged helix-turn-helix transcriptional regulator [Streptomyces sp. NPDC006645]|uniref:MarR family winged helix-turn-helix transcriptional regulator n=1 Tax=unclassified Streptomyces TaxID=2593676 RepID=UPI0033A063A6
MPPSASPPTRQPHDLVRLLTGAERLVLRRLRAVLDAAGTSVDAWRVLSLLSDGQGHRMSAVADCVFLPPPTLTKLVDQLVDQNLVHRRVDPLDRRRILAYLTDAGRVLWSRLDQEIRDDWARLPLAAEEDELTRGLGRLVATLEAAEAGRGTEASGVGTSGAVGERRVGAVEVVVADVAEPVGR